MLGATKCLILGRTGPDMISEALPAGPETFFFLAPAVLTCEWAILSLRATALGALQ